ncbi:hypothetical protein [Sorangium sp. So ce1024]|uniref:hypothetical protein n=1 Tax=Sorangium sp. So ce1024 TaxID=3133327 RepID=UPI003F1141E0
MRLELRTAAGDGKAAAVLREAVEQISQPAEFWARAVDFVSIHIDEIGGKAASITQLLVLELLRHRKTLRVPFFQTVEDRILFNVDRILPEIDLDVDECLAVIARCASGARDPIVPFYSEGLLEWARLHTETARAVVEAWLSGEARTNNLPPRVLGAITEGATKGTGGLEWKQEVLARLGTRPDEESWALAVFLACFAWQEAPPPPEERHIALQSQVTRCPRRLIGAGIAALHREAHTCPQEAFDRIFRLVELLDPQTLPWVETLIVATRAIGAFATALDTAQKQSLRIDAPERAVSLALLIPPIFSTPPGLVVPTDPLQGLDYFLYHLYPVDPRCVFNFISEWVLQYGGPLAASQRDLSQIFPMLTHHVGPDVVGAWTIEWLCADKPDLRHWAAIMLTYVEAPNLPIECLQALSERKIKVLTHEILAFGHNMRAVSLVRTLFHLLEVKPTLEPFFTEVFVDEIAQMYPGTCRDELEQRRALPKRTVKPSTIATEQALHKHLQERDSRLERRLAVPEFRATSPSRLEWFLWQQQVQRELQRHGANSSPLMRFALQMVIARGEGSTTGTTSPSGIKFKRFHFSAELAGDAIIDRPGAALRRLDHWQKAASLLKGSGDDA